MDFSWVSHLQHFVGGYALTTIANTIFLHNLVVLFTIPLLYWKLSEKTHSNIILGAFISLVGVGCISGVSIFHHSHFTNPRFLIGDILAILSAVGYAGVLVWTQICRKYNLPILGTLFVSWTTAAITLIVITLLSEPFRFRFRVFGGSWDWLFSLLLPFVLLSHGMKKVTAGLASLLSMTEVLFATLLGVFIYNETLAPVGWFGGLLVAIGILYPLFAQNQHLTNHTTSSSYPTSKRWLQIRNLRIIYWILALNISVYFGILQADLFLCVAILLVLFHLLQPSVAALLDYQYVKLQRIATTIFGLIILMLLWMVLDIFETQHHIEMVSFVLFCSSPFSLINI